MLEIKARLYDIDEELKALEKRKTELVGLLKAKAMELDNSLFQPVLMAKVLEVGALNTELIGAMEKIRDLNEERQQLKNKLEVLND